MAEHIVALSEILRHVGDPCPVEPEKSYPIMGVYGFGRGPITRPPVRGAEISAEVLYRVRAGQVIYSKLKAFEGAYTVVPPYLDGYFTSSEFPSFEVDTQKADVRYLEWLFRRPEVWREIAVGSKGIGARRERVNPAQLLSYKVGLPSLSDQKRIVGQLDSVAALVAERRRAIEAAERETQSMLFKAFQRAIQDAPLRPMSEVAPLVRRQVKIDAEATYTEVGVRSFYRGIFHRRTLPGSEFSWQDLFWLKKGDLVFSNLMAWEKAIALAGAEDEGTVGNHRMLTCEVNPDLATPGFLMAYFRTFEGYSSIVGHSPGTIARNKTLSSKKLPTIKVPVPDMAKQRWFDQLEAKANEARAIRARTAADVEALIPAMLHEIFSGKAAAA